MTPNCHLPQAIMHQMFRQALEAAPNECVGLLSGHGQEIRACHPLENTLHHPRRFLANPAQHLAVQRRVREAGQQLLAIYHSHPCGPARLSWEDLRQLNHPELLHIVISLQEPLTMAAYRVLDGQVGSPIPVVLVVA